MPAEGFPGVWKAIVDALKGHPEALLAVGMVLAGGGLLTQSVNPFFACGLPIAIYGLYVARMRYREAHQERMAERDVLKLERTKGIEAARKAQRALERRRKQDG